MSIFTNNLKKTIAIFIILLVLVVDIFVGNQAFKCDKSLNICYSTIAGVKLGDGVKINEIKNIKISDSDIRTKRGYFHGYLPTLITTSGDVSFYPVIVLHSAKAQQDLDAFISFMRSDKNNLILKNPCYIDAILPKNWVGTGY